jgi:hypothetical protein
MMRPVLPLFLIAAVLTHALPAAAQAPAATTQFSHLDSRLLLNRTVYVQTAAITRDQRGWGIKGKVLKVSDSTLWLQVKGKVREFPASDVLVLSQRHSHTGLGALAGFAAGAGAAALLSRDSPEYLTFAVGMLGGFGAMAGAATGSRMETERVVYLASDLAPSQTVKIQPIVGRHATGLAAAFRF